MRSTARANVFIADKDNHRVRMVDPVSGLISTVAGTGVAGTTGDGGDAIAAQLNEPRGIAVDTAGNVFIGEDEGHVVRKVDAATGTISTVLGTGAAGCDAPGGTGTSVAVEGPRSMVVDDDGDLLVGLAKCPAIIRVEGVGSPAGPVVMCNGLRATIVGTDADDVIVGTDGDDVIDAGDGNDVVDARRGDDTVCGGKGDDEINGRAGNDTLLGERGVDLLRGGPGDDMLDGGTGNDQFRDGPGNDNLTGGAGNDRFVGDGGINAYFGGDGAGDLLDFRNSAVPVTVDLGAGTIADSVRIIGTVGGVERLRGSPQGDTFIGGAEDNSLIGLDGDDILMGRGGADTIAGNLGDDDIQGEEGDDFLTGGQGDDTIDGGSGTDHIAAGPGTDGCIGGETVFGCE